jgi:hypothetical protein
VGRFASKNSTTSTSSPPHAIQKKWAVCFGKVGSENGPRFGDVLHGPYYGYTKAVPKTGPDFRPHFFISPPTHLRFSAHVVGDYLVTGKVSFVGAVGQCADMETPFENMAVGRVAEEERPGKVRYPLVWDNHLLSKISCIHPVPRLDFTKVNIPSGAEAK